MFYETDGQIENAKAACQKAIGEAADGNAGAHVQLWHLDCVNGKDEAVGLPPMKQPPERRFGHDTEE